MSGCYLSKEEAEARKNKILETLEENYNSGQYTERELAKYYNIGRPYLNELIEIYVINRGIISIQPEELTEEKLYELYITQNLSILKITGLTGLSRKQILKLLDKYNIIKSPELQKQQVKNSKKLFYANRTKEQYIHKSKACRARWDNCTEEEKIKWMEPLNKVNAQRSPEHEAALIKSYKKFLENESEEARVIRLENIRIATTKGIQNMSLETKLEANRKRLESWQNKTEEEKQEIIEKRRQTILAKSPEEKINIIERWRLAKLKNGNFYISSDEKLFMEYLNDLGYKTHKFYMKEHLNTHSKSEVDIYISEQNLGIEINGIYFHSTNGGNHKEKDYHYNKTEDAILNNFNLMHIWEDWIHTSLGVCKNIIFHRLNLSHTKTLNNYTYIQIDQPEFENLRKNFTLDYSKNYSYMYKLEENNKCYAILGINVKDNIVEFNLFENPLYIAQNIIQNTIKFIINTFNTKKIYTYLMRDIYIADNYLSNNFIITNYTEPNRFLVKGNYQRFYTNMTIDELKTQERTDNIFECYGSGYIKLEYKDASC